MGKCTAVTTGLSKVDSDVLLSLQCKSRTIDLQVLPKEDNPSRNQWVSLFEWLIQNGVRAQYFVPASGLLSRL